MDKRRKNNWNSGCIAGMLTAVFLQPFDVLKTYSIVSSKNNSSMIKGYRLALSKFGILGLWRGVSAALSRAMLGSGSYFLLIEEFKYISGSNNIVILGICSGLAKAIVTALCQPISLIKVRMESPTCQIYSGLLNGAHQIYTNEGIKGFYKGLLPSLIKDVPYSTLGYAFYEKYIEIFSKVSDSNRKNPIITFFAGVFAGFTATLMTQPFDVIKTKIQFHNIKGKEFSSFWEATKLIYNEDGLVGFQRGIFPRIAKRFISFPLVWTLYEQIRLTY